MLLLSRGFNRAHAKPRGPRLAVELAARCFYGSQGGGSPMRAPAQPRSLV
jgi:hypothetical protein